MAVSVNNVAFTGSGIPRPMGDKIIVEGLVPNESYVFAIAAIDDRGKVVQGIGETSVPIVALLPLPTLLIWGHLCLSAHQMGLDQLARSAGSPPPPSICFFFITLRPRVERYHRLCTLDTSPSSPLCLIVQILSLLPPPLPPPPLTLLSLVD